MATLRTDFTNPAQKNRKGSTVHYEDVAPNEDAFNFFRQPHVPAGAELPSKRRRKFILCFDGTGNKFSGTDADSNILKVSNMGQGAIASSIANKNSDISNARPR